MALQQDGWCLRSDIIWSKPNPMPESVTDRPTKSHEYIFLLTKRERYYYDAEAVKEPVSGTAHKRQPLNGKPASMKFKMEAAGNGNRNNPSFQSYMQDLDPELGRNKRTVWTVPSQPYPESHFATFPEDLIKPCILAGSKPGDTVLDPFGGSGTTAQVALELGRKAVIIELNPKYIPLIENRTNITPGLALA